MSRGEHRGALGQTLATFNQLEKKQKGLIILLCWYGSKDPYVILLPGHILYRKPGGHKIVYTGVKFKSSFNVVKNHTNRFCLL